MKVLKISLVLIVMIAIIFFGLRSFITTEAVDEIASSENKEQILLPEGASPEANPPKQGGATSNNDKALVPPQSSQKNNENEASKKLENEFWRAVKDIKNQKRKTFSVLESKVKEGELKTFLTKICKTESAFEKFKNTPGIQSCKTIQDLKNKIK